MLLNKKVYSFLLVITLLAYNTLYAQCTQSLEAFNLYFNKNLLKLDPIEGVWKVSRTTRMYSNGNLRQIKRFDKSETWIITKNGNLYTTCYPEFHSLDYSFEWLKKDLKTYVLKKNYNFNKSCVYSSAIMDGKMIKFSINESNDYLKEILKEKFQSDITIEHDYQLIKMEDYFDKITNQIPQVKNWFLNGIKSYIEDIFN